METKLLMNKLKCPLYQLICMSALFWIGCSSSKKESPTIETVILKQQNIPSTSLLNVRNFVVKDPYILSVNSREDSIFIVLDKQTGEVVSSWGRRGNGPGEYGLFTHIIDGFEKRAIAADFSKLKTRDLVIPEFELISESNITNDRYEPQVSEIPQKIVYGGDSIFFYDKYMMHEIKLTRWKNHSEPIEIYHFDDLQMEFPRRSDQMFGGRIAVNPGNKRIIYAHRFLNRFIILDYDGQLIAKKDDQLDTEKLVFSDEENLDFTQSPMYYLQARSVNESFFLLKVGEIDSNWIEEYDMQGNLRGLYKTGNKITDFDVLSDSKGEVTFIGLDQGSEQPFLLLY